MVKVLTGCYAVDRSLLVVFIKERHQADLARSVSQYFSHLRYEFSLHVGNGFLSLDELLSLGFDSGSDSCSIFLFLFSLDLLYKSKSCCIYIVVSLRLRFLYGSAQYSGSLLLSCATISSLGHVVLCALIIESDLFSFVKI